MTSLGGEFVGGEVVIWWRVRWRAGSTDRCDKIFALRLVNNDVRSRNLTL